MALYRIQRQLGEVTPTEIDAAAFRALACTGVIEGLTWVRSFYDAQARLFTCYYEARSPVDIRAHAELAGIPCDSVTEVFEYRPEQYR